MAQEESFTVIAALVKDLCRTSPFNASPHPKSIFKSTPKPTASGKIILPGTDSLAKQNLESELEALISRLQYLEAKANTVSHHALPDTPNEFAPTSPFVVDGASGVQHNTSTRPAVRKNSNSVRQARVTNILAGKTFSEEELGTIRDHLDKQSEEIKSQSETINDISAQLEEQQHTLKDTFVKVENEDLTRLERELKKHSQANEAFQTALKEIGVVISSIASGDLSKKVKIHTKEMDDEIIAFKRTINTMVDHLMAFGKEVSRVAKEVGTEGKLGGQAQIPHVSGIWGDVTYNGKQRYGYKHSCVKY